jgi:osmotically-inducible protein OsmY
MKNNKIKDKELLKLIQMRVRWDIRVSNSDIAIKVKNGCVHLSGVFDKPYRHAAAVDIIKTTEGVKEFLDHSKIVKGYFRSDKALEILISKQLLSLPLLQGEWIDVEVSKGVARLKGHVFRSRLKAFAARATWELSGVRDCINLIELTASPMDLKKTIPMSLFNFGNLRFLEAA